MAMTASSQHCFSEPLVQSLPEETGNSFFKALDTLCVREAQGQIHRATDQAREAPGVSRAVVTAQE